MTEFQGDDSTVTFTFDGATVEAAAGQSIGAALIQHGTRILRYTRSNAKPRSLFCGIGVCFDCLVTINGVPNQRACLSRVSEGAIVQTQEGTGSYLFPETGTAHQ